MKLFKAAVIFTALTAAGHRQCLHNARQYMGVGRRDPQRFHQLD